MKRFVRYLAFWAGGVMSLLMFIFGIAWIVKVIHRGAFGNQLLLVFLVMISILYLAQHRRL